MNEQTNTTQEEMRPCEGCGGQTKKNTIKVECWECHGEGSVEDDDPLTGEYFWRRCWNCDGRTVIEVTAWYCSSECYEMDDYEDDF